MSREHTLVDMADDAFDILGVRPDFGLEREEIERAYLTLAERLHPDLASGSPDAARLMADLNRAKKTLANPESRADALLVRLGGPAADREKSLPPGFLGHVMEVREQIEDSLSAQAGADAAARREVWDHWSRGQREEAIRSVRHLFSQLSGASADRPAILRDVRVRLNAWRYIERLIEQLDPAGGRAG